MSNIEEIKIPDIGDFDSVEVIEIAVSVGDSVEIEDTLITVESDKATMDIPSPNTGEIIRYLRKLKRQKKKKRRKLKSQKIELHLRPHPKYQRQVS